MKINELDILMYVFAIFIGMMIAITVPKMQENLKKADTIAADINRIANSFEYYNERRF